MMILSGWMAPDDSISAGSMARHPTNPLLLYLPSAGSPIRDGRAGEEGPSVSLMLDNSILRSVEPRSP